MSDKSERDKFVEEKMKNLTVFGNSVDVDPNVPIKRYDFQLFRFEDCNKKHQKMFLIR